ncbi:MAG: Hsp33 family molecular chaperone HslO [Clostridiales bacterium]|nr:Hsp33 family molecular chaperone HslO [Clostridiales bacterium]
MKDELVRALAYGGNVAVLAANTTRLAGEAQRVHGTWPVCTAALGRALTGAILMASSIKHPEGSVSLVFSGNGPAGNVVAVARPGAEAKGYVENPRVDLPLNDRGKLDVGGAVGREGTLTVVMDTGRGEPYCGKTALVSGEVAEDIAAHFLFSQQQPTLSYLGVLVAPDMRVLRSGGVLMQPLPGCPGEIVGRLEAQAEALTSFGDAIFGGAGAEEALGSILPDAGLRVLERTEPRWRCGCSPERMEGALVALGPRALEEIIEEDGGAELNCRFCNRSHRFDGPALKGFLEAAFQA